MARSQNHYHKLARIALWSLFTLFGFLAYVAEIRPFFSSFGAYIAGFLDCIVIVHLVLVMGFYLRSWIKPK